VRLCGVPEDGSGTPTLNDGGRYRAWQKHGMRARSGKPVSLMQYAVAQLARREHSRAELRMKLRRRRDRDDPSGAAAAIEAVLDELQRKGLLSDARFATLLTRTRADRFGTARIQQELRGHELADEIVRPEIERLKATEEERARDLWRRKFGRPAADAAERARQMRFLAQRGFSSSVVLRVVKSAPAEEDRD